MYFNADIVAAMTEQQRRQMGITQVTPGSSFAVERKQLAAYVKMEQPAAAGPRARVQTLNDGNASNFVTGDQEEDLAQLAADERKFIKEKIKHQEMQSWVKGRSATSVSVCSSKVMTRKLLTPRLQRKTCSWFRLTTAALLSRIWRGQSHAISHREQTLAGSRPGQGNGSPSPNNTATGTRTT